MERTNEDLLKEVEVLRRQSDDKEVEILKLRWRLDELEKELEEKSKIKAYFVERDLSQK
jgi:hypothetical protein